MQAGANPKPGKVAMGEGPILPCRGAGGGTLLRKMQGQSWSREQPECRPVCPISGVFPLLTRGSRLERQALWEPSLEGEGYSVPEGGQPKSQAGWDACAGGAAARGTHHAP